MQQNIIKIEINTIDPLAFESEQPFIIKYTMK